MNIKPTSKTLSRVLDETSYSITYHKTKVLEFSHGAKILTFKTDGWETRNTANAMTYGLRDLNIRAYVVYRNNKKEQGLFLIQDSKKIRIKHNTTLKLEELL